MSGVTTSQRFPVTVERTARYSDLDPTRRLGRDALLRWFEDARVAVERDAFDSDLTTREHWQVKRLLAGVRVDVLAPLKVTGRPYEVGLGVTHIGRSSFSYAYGVYDGDDCVATGASTSVHVGEKGSAPLPDDVRSQLERLRVEAAEPVRAAADADRLVREIYPFRVDVRARFGDLDTNRHVNNVALAGWYLDALAELHLDVLGYPTGGPLDSLADEINRTPPKTQAALLEAMQERRVTLDGQSHLLGDRFMVVATQNPIEQQGTYPLPEAQLDRFLFKQTLEYPSEAEERGIVSSHGVRLGMPDPGQLGVTPVSGARDVAAAIEAVSARQAERRARALRRDAGALDASSADIAYGASPRAAAMIATAARTRAVLEGRDYVIPDDIKALMLPALRHRLVLSPAAEIDGRRVEDVISGIVERIEAPR